MSAVRTTLFVILFVGDTNSNIQMLLFLFNGPSTMDTLPGTNKGGVQLVCSTFSSAASQHAENPITPRSRSWIVHEYLKR